MLKKLCPYCDHEIGNSSKCKYCGSRVRKPVVIETAAEFTTAASSMPGDCDCTIHSPEAHPHNDGYRDSTDASFEGDFRKAYESDRASVRSRTNAGRREDKTKNENQSGGKILKMIIIIYTAVVLGINIISIIRDIISAFSPF